MPNKTVVVFITLVVATILGFAYYMNAFNNCFGGVMPSNYNISFYNTFDKQIYDGRASLELRNNQVNNNSNENSNETVTKKRRHPFVIDFDNSNTELTKDSIFISFQDSKPFSNYGDGSCSEDSIMRETLRRIFLKWTSIANQYKVPYFLNYGTLLGAWRNGDIIPGDTDIDLNIEIEDIRKLETFQTHGGFRLYIQKDWKLPEDQRRRFNCDGKSVNSQVDNCSFIEPIARLIELSSGFRIDIYAAHIVFDTVLMFSDDKWDFRRDQLLPLRRCKFMGVDSFCPNKPKEILTSFYGQNLRPLKICKNKIWIQN